MAITRLNSLAIPAGTVETADLSYPLTNFSSTGIDDNATSTAITIDASQNVGLGTPTPTAGHKLHVIGRILAAGPDNGAYILAKDTNTGGAELYINPAFAGAGTPAIQVGTNHPLLFATNNTERMRIDSSGNVGIGTTSPTGFTGYTTLDINNATNGAIIDLSQGDAMKGRLVATSSTMAIETASSVPIIFQPVGSEAARIDTFGNVGIGSTTPPSQLAGTNGLVIEQTTPGFALAGASRTFLQYVTGTTWRMYDKNVGVDRITLNSSGNVGLGTTSPAALLHLNSNSDTYFIVGTTNATADARIQFRNSAGTDAGGLWYATNGNNMLFRTNSAERMRIDSGGVIKLITANDTAGTSKFLTFGTNSFNRAGIKCTNAATYDGSLEFYTGNSVNFAERMRIDSSGRVGIGTTNPTTDLQIGLPGNYTDSLLTVRQAGNNIDWGHGNTAGYGSTLGSSSSSGAPFIGLSCGAGTNANTFRTYGLKGSLIHTDNAGAMLFSRITTASADNQTPAESMRIDSSGNLLVGTTSSVGNSGKFQAVRSNTGAIGYFEVDNGGGAQNAVDITNAANAAFVPLRFWVNGYGGSLVGSISCTTSATTYNTSSDQRLKENIVDAPAGNIDAIRVRSFDWKVDGSHQTYGMVAQELVDVAPEAVSQGATEDDMWQVDYSKLVPMMIKEIQDLKAEVAALKGV